MNLKNMCAHRGFNFVAPENTLPAFASAIALGAAEIEFDLWPTLDGDLVVCHDPSIDRTTTGTGNIVDLHTNDVRTADAGTPFQKEFIGVQVPLFEEVLQQFGNRVIMNIHIKSLKPTPELTPAMKERWKAFAEVYYAKRPLVPFVDATVNVLPEMEEDDGCVYDKAVFSNIIALIDKYNCRESVYITGERDVLKTAVNLAPDIKRCCLEGHMNFTIVEHALEYGCARVQFCKCGLTQAMIDKAHANGIHCNLFWSDNADEAKQFLEMGIDTILTNNLLETAQKL